MRSFGLSILLILFSLSISSVSAEIYHYTDSAGTIHFTNVPTDPRFKKLKSNKPPPAATKKVDRNTLDTLILQASEAQRLSPALVKAVIRAESNFNPRAVSSSGAQGLMQLMPETAGDLKLTDPFNPAKNIDAGTRYLRYLLDRFDQNLRLAIAAYHAGPGTVSRYGGVPPIKKTQTYLRTVLRFFDFYRDKAGRSSGKNTEKKSTGRGNTILTQNIPPSR
ncbi:MAG: transglycosylase SLT domain-containing protein [Nitrospiria bacterium]